MNEYNITITDEEGIILSAINVNSTIAPYSVEDRITQQLSEMGIEECEYCGNYFDVNMRHMVEDPFIQELKRKTLPVFLCSDCAKRQKENQ